MNPFDTLLNGPADARFFGLAPFLRSNIAGTDLRTVASQLLEQMQADDSNPLTLINLSIVLQCLSQKALGLALQEQALKRQVTYRIAAHIQPARLRLLMLLTRGSIQSYTPLECLLEASDIELVFHYIFPGANLLSRVPEHDALFVAIADSDENRDLLVALEAPLAHWPKPVLNAPQFLKNTVRDTTSAMLSQIDHLQVPPTVHVSRADLQSLAAGATQVSSLIANTNYPIIARPLRSQGGVNLKKLTDAQDTEHYLAQVAEPDFFVSPFVDYSDARGFFKKIRIALIDGKPYVAHMAISSDWMIHYVNAGMYQEAWKREEEAHFMREFDAFAERHGATFREIARRMQLEYLVMDCAETNSGDLLLFEIDTGGVVHAMDVEAVFPYKNAHVAKAKEALCELLYARTAHNG